MPDLDLDAIERACDAHSWEKSVSLGNEVLFCIDCCREIPYDRDHYFNETSPDGPCTLNARKETIRALVARVRELEAKPNTVKLHGACPVCAKEGKA